MKLLKKKKVYYFIHSIILNLCLSTLYAHPSLFFTHDEMLAIHKIPNQDKPFSTLLLSSLLYIDKTHWAVWINGRCIRPNTLHLLKNIKVVEVTEHHVKIRLKDKQKTLILLPQHEVFVQHDQELLRHSHKSHD